MLSRNRKATTSCVGMSPYVSFAAVEARMVYSLLGGAAAIVRVDYVLHKCAFGATEAQ